MESPEPGEVVWADDLGVTCRRWNRRPCTRTRITHSTTRAVFVLDALGAVDDEALTRAGESRGCAPWTAGCGPPPGWSPPEPSGPIARRPGGYP